MLTVYQTDRAAVLLSRRRRKAQSDAIRQARRRLQDPAPAPLELASVLREVARTLAQGRSV